MHKTIESEDDLKEGVEWLLACEPRFRRVTEATGLPALRRAEGGLPGLLRIITEQMISLKAADAIWRRIEKELAPLDPPAILRRRHATLMKLGLSGAKSRTFRSLAKAAHKGELLVDKLHLHSNEDAIAALVALPGIGPWTADIYVLSCLGRADAWPTGDLALQASAADLFGLAKRPDARAMLELAEKWRPWRSVAARLLWAHYRSLKGLPQAV
ncbi:DNA-3-methyladenine glycosylase family protein [Taklimakanibacter lacteus]|uniref:DNA-3-methyladenine glycosylase family protein n=1 Tax=Taklimakanibacter lacteus TaxID=2268456 RepID=UPI000E675206